MKLLRCTTFLAMALIGLNGFTAAPTLRDEVSEQKSYKPRESHYQFSFGIGLNSADASFEEFSGSTQGIHDKSYDVLSYRLDFGRQTYLGNRFSLLTRLEAYYGNERNRTEGIASEDVPLSIKNNVELAQLYGADLSLGLTRTYIITGQNIIFGTDYKLYFEPFFEVTAGYGKGLYTIDYEYNDLTSVEEYYSSQVKDDILTTKVSIGFNLISTSNFFLVYRLGYGQTNALKRDIKYEYQADGDASSTTGSSSKNGVRYNSSVFHTLGGGYRF